MSVRRVDRGELQKPVKLPNGWLRVDARLTRTGVFIYREPDGTERREYRPPEEVFATDALSSFSLVPVTDDHPGPFLDATNTRTFARGAAGDRPVKDGDFVRAQLLVTDAELIAKLEDGAAREVSCGYSCDLEFNPGTAPNGERYDAIQRGIRGNHVAIVRRGRAGPEARVRMDAAGIGVVRSDPDDEATPTTTKRNDTMGTKMRIDGVEHEASESARQAFEVYAARRDAEVAAAKKAAEEAAARADKAEAKADASAAELKKRDEELKALPAKLAAEAKVRVELEAKARAVLGPKAKLDGLDDLAVRRLVLEELNPGLKLDGKSAAYVEARFDAAIESAEAKADRDEDETEHADAPEVDEEIEVEAKDSEDEDERQDSKPALQPFERMLKRNGIESR